MLSLIAAAALAAEPTHLSVDEALAALEAHNPSIARADAALAGAKGSATVALSGVLPTLTATGGYTRNNKEVTLDLSDLFDVLGAVAEMTGQTPPDAPSPTVLQPLDAFSGAATVRVPLITPVAWAQIGAANHGVQAAESSATATRSSLRSAALQAFYGEAAAEGLLRAQDASVGRARTLAASAGRAAEAGTSTRLAKLQAETELARREGDLLQASATLEKARIAVGILLGSPEPVAVDLPEVAAAAVTGEAASLDLAYAARGEVAAAAEAVDVARSQLLAVQLGALPTVSGAFSAFASTEPYPTGDDTGWKATVDLTWPLLQGGLRAGNEARARAALSDADAALAAVKLQVAQQVRSAAADLRVATARVEVTGRQVALAEEAAGVSQRSFDQGILDAPGVLDALDRLDVARASQIDAHARLGIADTALRAALGRW